jgi:LysM repeat protein
VRLVIAIGVTVLALALLAVARQHDRAKPVAGGRSAGGSSVVTAPVAAPTTLAFTDPVPYVVQPGEALAVIAKRNGLTIDELARFNGIADPNRVQAGDRLLIPPPSPTTTTTATTRSKGPTTTTTLPRASTLPDDPPTTESPPPFGVTTTFPP